jgi:hypothetical protein
MAGGANLVDHPYQKGDKSMSELIAVTTTDGRTEIINLDYVVKIEAAHQNKSSITIVANLVPMLAMLMLVKGTPSEIASAHRIQGKQAP